MAPPSPYSRFDTEHLTLRDVLAVDRTNAANERTLLGYLRTTLALLASGGSLLHFVDKQWATIAGIVIMASSIPLLSFGLRSYFRRRRTLTPLMGVVSDDD